MSAAVIHLDTNVLIGALIRESAADHALQRWLRSGHTVAMSSIAWSEFLCGSSALSVNTATRTAARQLIGEPLPFDAVSAELAAELFNATGRRRGSLGDCMVAACAIAHQASLATANVVDFAPMHAAGLVVHAV